MPRDPWPGRLPRTRRLANNSLAPVTALLSALMSCVVIDACSTASDDKDAGAPDTGILDAQSEVGPETDACIASQTDSNNCGKCGHSCLGGICSSGQCQPFVFATAQHPTALAVDANNLYWADQAIWYYATGSIWKLGLTGGTPPVQLASKQHNPTSLTIDSTNVYWAENVLPGGSVWTVPIDGGVATDLEPADAYCTAVAVTDAAVIWSQADPAAGLFALPKTGGGTPVMLDPNEAAGVVIDGTYAYWTGPMTGNIARTSLVDDSGTVILAAGQQLPMGIVLSNGALFWGNQGGLTPDGGGVMTMTLDGSTPVTVVGGQSYSNAVAVDDTDVYFCDLGSQTAHDGSVMRVPRSGGNVSVVADQQGDPIAIAVDATSVYWANNLDGTIMRLAK